MKGAQINELTVFVTKKSYVRGKTHMIYKFNAYI